MDESQTPASGIPSDFLKKGDKLPASFASFADTAPPPKARPAGIPETPSTDFLKKGDKLPSSFASFNDTTPPPKTRPPGSAGNPDAQRGSGYAGASEESNTPPPPPPRQSSPPPPSGAVPPAAGVNPLARRGGVELETVAEVAFSEDGKKWKMFPWFGMRMGDVEFADDDKTDDEIVLFFGKHFMTVTGKRLEKAFFDIQKNAVCRISPSRNAAGEAGEIGWVRKVVFGSEKEEEEAEKGEAE